MEEVNKGSKSMQIITVVLLVILVGFAAYFAYTVTNSDDTAEVNDDNTEVVVDDNEEEGNTVEVIADTFNDTVEEVIEEEEETASASNVVPDGWKAVENDNYNYTAYRPSNYYYRFFGSQSLLGIDPNEIPEVGSYAGAITMMALSGDLEAAKNTYISSFLAISETTETHENGTWTIVQATVPENLMEGEKQVIMAFIEKSGQTFVVDYRSEASSFSTYESVFDSFYPAVLFE